jgi:hypothetical protein
MAFPKYNMKTRFGLFLIICVLFCSCGLIDFAKGEREDAQRIAISGKRFFKALSFKGVIDKKIYCPECDDRGNYKILIALKTSNPDSISFNDQYYQPDYFFNIERKELTMAVTKNIYDNVKIGAGIEKEKASNSILLFGKSYALLNDAPYKWLVDQQ